ncbi:universal stress protein [Enterococcus sp. BWR-S5]|nr:universal stress protein [Enterococcus sp. BWR-S5]
MTDKYTNILVAVDDSVQSEKAFIEAVAIAKRNEASLTVMNSIDLTALSFGPLMMEEVTKLLYANAEELLNKLVNSMYLFKIEKKVSIGIPKQDIINYAEQMKIDLIVVGATGKGRITRALVGSTASYVVNHAPCDVLTASVLIEYS